MAAVGQQIDYAERGARARLTSLDDVYQQFGVDSAPYGLAIERMAEDARLIRPLMLRSLSHPI